MVPLFFSIHHRIATIMKTKIAILLLILGLQSCNKSNPGLQGPAIKSVSFEGVPSQNVDFDRARSTITIQLPTGLRGGLKPTLELTDGTRVVSGVAANGFVDLTPLCSCQGYQGRSATIMVGDTSAIATQRTRKGYLIRIANQGPLKALDSDIPLTFSRRTNKLVLYLPIENLYTNPYITQVKFTNVETGVGPLLNADGNCLNGCSNSALNQLIFSFSAPTMSVQYLTPGTYTVTAGGVDFPQKLVVTE